MNELQKNTILAYRIGLYLIAVIVNEFYDQLRTDPELVEPFRVVNTWSDHKAQLTYFWWVTRTSSTRANTIWPRFASLGCVAGLVSQSGLISNRSGACRNVDENGITDHGNVYDRSQQGADPMSDLPASARRPCPARWHLGAGMMYG